MAAQNTFPANGSVGIGTTAPGAPLDIDTNAALYSYPGLALRRSDNHFVHLYSSLPASYYNYIVQAGDQAIIYSNGTNGTGAFVIASWSYGAGGFRMDNNGFVGIGTPTPAQLLQVGASYVGSPSIMIGGHDSNNADTGTYSLLFGDYRDIESTVASGIVATPAWTCCGGYPASGGTCADFP